MTQIIKQKSTAAAPEQQDALLDYSKPENEEIADEIQRLKLYIAGDKMEGNFLVPRFGLLSLKMRHTPMYAYDHPAFLKLSNTAFTDGVHVFMAAPFYTALMKEEDSSKGMEQGPVPLVLHELMHMILNHTRRLQMFPKDIANQAEDLSINSKLQLGFPEIKWVPSLREVGLAFRAGDAERYAKLAEETIARELMEKRSKNKDGKGEGQGGGSGKGKSKGSPSQQSGKSGGKPQPGQGDPQDGEGGGDPQEGQGGADDKWSDNHTVTPEEMIKTLEENGLGHIKEKLQLPDSDDAEQIGKLEEQVRLMDIDAIQKAAMQKSQMGGKYPGAHIVDAAEEMVKGFTEGKLAWKLGLKNFVFGEGMRFKHVEDAEPGDLYYVEAKAMGLPNEIYIGQDLPHKPEETVLVLIDTSGSVDSNQLKGFLSEVFNLKRENSGVGDTASEILVLSADTVVRHDFLEITEDNVDELMEKGVGLKGRGGTDLANDLRQAMKLLKDQERKCAGVVFCTDLCDTPPKKEDFDSTLPICFITMPNTYSEEFARAVKDWARVYPIEAGIEVDLSDDWKQTAVNTRKMKA